MCRFLLIFTILFSAISVTAQTDILNKKITLKVRKQALPEILKAIEKEAGVSFNFNQKIIPNGKYNLQANAEELSVVLVDLLTPHNLTFSLLYGHHIVITKVEKKVAKHIVTGYVTDELSGEKLIGVTIYNQTTLTNSNTNQDGYYALSLKEDSVTLVFSKFPYKKQAIKIYLRKDTSINIVLKDEQEFPNFTLTSKPDNQLNYKPDEINLGQRAIKKFPVLFGETDVLKGLQLLPGVSSGSDGTIGLNIRGGGADQNLILLDDVPIYNPSHIFGFFSVFNSDIVKDVKLIKGGMPARYSGRVSSVIDVRSLDGNTKKIKAQVSLGTLSSKLTIDGPIGKNKKTTFIVGARRSYFDLFNTAAIASLISADFSQLKTGYYFYDANGKINHQFSDKHQLSFSFYTGLDNLFIKNSFSLKDPEKLISERDKQTIFWGNRLYSLRDHHVWSPKVSAWANLSHSSYGFGNESSYEYSENTDTVQYSNAYLYKFKTSIQTTNLSYNIEYKTSDWLTIITGIGSSLHDFKRDITSSDNITNTNIRENSSNKVTESNGYVEGIWKVRRRLIVNTGVHQVMYALTNKTYYGTQPRLSVNYKFKKNWLLHGGYQSTMQFLHLLTGITGGIPIDLWLPSTTNIKPETGKLISGGISYAKGDFVVNLEGFNKRMSNLIDYKDQANYVGVDNNWEQKITSGKGLAYGYELLLEKRNGKTKGWISYTLSWNNRQFDLINQGRVFPYRYDRRHNVAVFLGHDFNKKVDMGVSWVYTSGANYTVPEQVYFLHSGLAPNNIIYLYGDRNNYQFPNYHRLDFGFNFKKQKKHYHRLLSIGAYNVYNRLNPFYIMPAYNASGNRVFEAVSLFPFLPSINYKLVF